MIDLEERIWGVRYRFRELTPLVRKLSGNCAKETRKKKAAREKCTMSMWEWPEV